MMSWLPRLGITGSPTLASSLVTVLTVSRVSSRVNTSSGACERSSLKCENLDDVIRCHADYLPCPNNEINVGVCLGDIFHEFCGGLILFHLIFSFLSVLEENESLSERKDSFLRENL